VPASRPGADRRVLVVEPGDDEVVQRENVMACVLCLECKLLGAVGCCLPIFERLGCDDYGSYCYEERT